MKVAIALGTIAALLAAGSALALAPEATRSDGLPRYVDGYAEWPS
jgi:hypothetical protein